MNLNRLETLRTTSATESERSARRAFLQNCAQYAVAVPPAISLVLSVSEAAAKPPCSTNENVNEKNPNCPGGQPATVNEGAVDPENQE